MARHPDHELQAVVGSSNVATVRESIRRRPVCRSLGKGLWEIRSSISDGRITRVIFCVADDKMVLLHGFFKKTQKTPKADLDLALNRMKEVSK